MCSLFSIFSQCARSDRLFFSLSLSFFSSNRVLYAGYVIPRGEFWSLLGKRNGQAEREPDFSFFFTFLLKMQWLAGCSGSRTSILFTTDLVLWCVQASCSKALLPSPHLVSTRVPTNPLPCNLLFSDDQRIQRSFVGVCRKLHYSSQCWNCHPVPNYSGRQSR